MSIDEGMVTMVPWKGRLYFRQYLPNKPDKFGMKLYILCDSETGYMSLFDVYTARDHDPNPEATEREADEGHSYNVIMGLLHNPHLFDDLSAEDTMAVGTVRLNRKEVPAALKTLKLLKGQVVYRIRENLLAFKWVDKRDVRMLSTIHPPPPPDIHNHQ